MGWVWLANVDTFIIRVGFGLANVDTIRTLTRHEHDPSTQIATPMFDDYCERIIGLNVVQMKRIDF